jgi:hypothetical protein
MRETKRRILTLYGGPVLHLHKTVLETETPLLPKVHPLAILGVMTFSVVLPSADRFQAGETHRFFPHVLNMPPAFITIAEDVFADAAIPLPSSAIE